MDGSEKASWLAAGQTLPHDGWTIDQDWLNLLEAKDNSALRLCGSGLNAACSLSLRKNLEKVELTFSGTTPGSPLVDVRLSAPQPSPAKRHSGRSTFSFWGGACRDAVGTGDEPNAPSVRCTYCRCTYCVGPGAGVAVPEITGHDVGNARPNNTASPHAEVNMPSPSCPTPGTSTTCCARPSGWRFFR